MAAFCLESPLLNIRTAPDLECQGWGIPGPWLEGGGWKGWRQGLAQLNDGCAWEGRGHPPLGANLLL